MVRKGRRSGYSLVEVMMVVAILGIISSVGAGLLLQANRFFIFTKTRGDLQRQARASMYVITRSLRQAQSTTIVIDRLNTSQPFYSRIAFTTVDGTSVTFEQSGKKLLQIVGSNQKTLADNLLYLAVTFPRSDDMTIVSVSMTLQQSIYQGRTKALHMASEKVQVMN